MSKIKKWFESTKIYWFIFELIKILSSEPSYFSKKRIESASAFIIGQIGMIYYLIEHIQIMTSTDIGIWSGIEFLIAGYTVNQIQKQKKNDYNKTNQSEQEVH